MRTDEEIMEALKEYSDDAVEKADAFCKSLKAFEKIDLGSVETEEDNNKMIAVLREIDLRRHYILKRVLMENGNLLFVQ